MLERAHWGTAPLLTPAADLPSPADLFGSAAVDTLLAERALRTPFLRMVQGGRPLPTAAYTLGGGVGASVSDQVSEDKVLQLFADGATIVLQGLHRTWRPVVDLAQDLAGDLGHPVQVNAYITPPSSRGFDVHYDVHDVFVLQVEGEKRWQLRPPVRNHPLRDEPSSDVADEVTAAAGAPPAMEETLRPGDTLYLPRGWLHSATALGATSIHLTFGVHVWTVRHLLQEVLTLTLDGLSERDEARQSLPVGIDIGDESALEPLLRSWLPAVADALADVKPEALAGALSARARAAQRPEPMGALAQVAAADDDGTRWRLRAHLVPSWSDGSLVTRVGRLSVDDAERPTVTALLQGADPADLPPALRRRLALAGILVPARRG